MTFFKKNKIKIINSKTDHTIMTHENIVMFLEKIENKRYHTDSEHSNSRKLQEQLVINGEIKREEEKIENTNDEVEELLSEVEIRNAIIVSVQSRSISTGGVLRPKVPFAQSVTGRCMANPGYPTPRGSSLRDGQISQ